MLQKTSWYCSHHSALQSLLVRDLLQVLIVLMIAMLHLKAAVMSREMASLLERHSTQTEPGKRLHQVAPKKVCQPRYLFNFQGPSLLQCHLRPNCLL